MFENEPILTNKAPSLEELSIDELLHRVTKLKEEISACEAEIEKKKTQKTEADALFGGKD